MDNMSSSWQLDADDATVQVSDPESGTTQQRLVTALVCQSVHVQYCWARIDYLWLSVLVLAPPWPSLLEVTIYG